MFTACFVITEQCNLDCDYCYMDNHNTFMPPAIFDLHYEKTLPYFMKHYNESEYYLDLFGGEPTLWWELIEHIVDRTKDDPHLKTIRLMTNGLFLKDKHVKFIKQHNIETFLSFDGLWAPKLDQYMKLKDIFSSLVDRCSVYITPKHMDMADNYKFLVEEFNLIPDFKIVRDNIWSDKDVDQFAVELDKLEEAYFEYLRKERNLIPKIFEHKLLMLLESSQHQMDKMRCFVGMNGVAFAPDGKVYPCARFMTNELIPLYDGKSFLDKNLEHINEFANKFSDECRNCEISDYCNHICLQQEYLNKGILKNVCRIYKLTTNKVIEINHKLKHNDIWISYVKSQYYGRTANG